MMFFLIGAFHQACSTQQVIGAGIAVAKVPVKATESVVRAAGFGGTVGGIIGGSTGEKYGKIAEQKAAKKAISYFLDSVPLN